MSRIILVPVFMALLMIPTIDRDLARLIGGLLFFAISMTDMFDGKIARKYDLVSDFGKFMDPLADKLLVFGSFLALMVFERDNLVFIILLAFATFITLLREFAVTSLRMLFKDKGVIPANMAGKIKTVSQIVFIVAALVEPLLWLLPFFPDFLKIPIITYASLAFMTFMTVYSGINYFVIYLGKKN